MNHSETKPIVGGRPARVSAEAAKDGRAPWLGAAIPEIGPSVSAPRGGLEIGRPKEQP